MIFIIWSKSINRCIQCLKANIALPALPRTRSLSKKEKKRSLENCRNLYTKFSTNSVNFSEARIFYRIYGYGTLKMDMNSFQTL